MFDRCSFVAVTTRDLARARRFWVEGLGCRVTEEEPGGHLIVDAGGLRLCIDLEDGDLHRAGGSDPVVGLKVTDLTATLRALASRGLPAERGPLPGTRGAWALLRDPDGRGVVLTEAD